MSRKNATCYGLTGGATGSLDSILSTSLTDNSMALTIDAAGVFYAHYYDPLSAAAESSPDVIKPDDLGVGAAGRWLLLAIALNNYATAAEIITGTEAAKAVAPDQLRASEATAAEIVTGTAVKLITANQAHTSLMKVSGSNLAIGADADGDMYYRASSLLARLAIGAANLKKFVNAAGTAPEWAAGLYIGKATRDLTAATGDVAYTGVGFKPNTVIFLGGINEATGAFWGFGNATVSYGLSANMAGTADNFQVFDTGCILYYIGAGVYQAAAIKTLDSDGFTLTWTKVGAPTGTLTVYYAAFR